MSGNRFQYLALALAGLLPAGACTDQPTEPAVELEPQFADEAMDPLGLCATDPDFVVTSYEQLLELLLGEAQEGDVIAIDGLIHTDKGAWTTTDGITITCATPGSGLVAAPQGTWDSEYAFLLFIYGRNVTVRGLVLDAAGVPRGPIYALNNGGTADADHLVFTHNLVFCGPETCLFFAGVSGSLIAENEFRSDSRGGGIHVQGQGTRDPDGQQPRPIDGTVIRGNVVVSTQPQEALCDPETGVCGFRGGIRAMGGSNVVVEQNTITGPWLNAISVTDLRDSRIANNTIENPARYGIALSLNRYWTFPASGNEFRSNTVRGAGSAGVFVDQACSNSFQGNNLNENADGLGLRFQPSTGANVYRGNKNVVLDFGNRDCNGDGIVDPNLLPNTGQGGGEAWTLTSYYWDGGWVRQTALDGSYLPDDLRIGFNAHNWDPYPGFWAEFDNILAFGDLDLPEGVIEDFDSGLIGDIWDQGGGACAWGNGAAACVDQERGVLHADVPPSMDSWHIVGLNTAPVVHGEFDVQMDFAVDPEFHSHPWGTANVMLCLWDESYRNSICTEIDSGFYETWRGLDGTAQPFPMGYIVGRTYADHNDGKLRITRTRVQKGQVEESVMGSGSFTTAEGAWRSFTFSARRYSDGTVDGQWERITRPNGNASDSKSHGVVTCFAMEGNQAWLGGFATSGSYDDFNDGVAWRVVDNGDKTLGVPDQISLQYVALGKGSPAAYCAAMQEDPTPLYDIEAGNIRINR
jgi:hypothetical protein